MLNDLLQMAEVLFEDGTEDSKSSECPSSVSVGHTHSEATEAITAGKDVYETFFS